MARNAGGCFRKKPSTGAPRSARGPGRAATFLPDFAGARFFPAFLAVRAAAFLAVRAAAFFTGTAFFFAGAAARFMIGRMPWRAAFQPDFWVLEHRRRKPLALLTPPRTPLQTPL